MRRLPNRLGSVRWLPWPLILAGALLLGAISHTLHLAVSQPGTCWKIPVASIVSEGWPEYSLVASSSPTSSHNPLHCEHCRALASVCSIQLRVFEVKLTNDLVVVVSFASPPAPKGTVCSHFTRGPPSA